MTRPAARFADPTSSRTAASDKSRPSLRRQGFAKGSGSLRDVATHRATLAAAKTSKFSGSLVFAGVAFAFGLALLLGWRFGPDGGSPGSILLIAGMFMTISGGYIGANELGVLSVLTGDSDSDGGGGDGGD